MFVFFSSASPLFSLIITLLGCSGLISWVFNSIWVHLSPRVQAPGDGPMQGEGEQQRHRQDSQDGRGWIRNMRNALSAFGVSWNMGAQFATTGRMDTGMQQEAAPQRQAPSDTRAVHRLPLIEYQTEEEVASWSVGRLKKELRMSEKKVCPGVIMEKTDLVKQVMESWGGTSSKNCAVCLVDYEKGDALRVLPCLHRYHVECIDKWLMSRSRACPLCNQPIN
ncbi:hypothetical protein CYMTET_45394 [Cymbomonas tetramitiformis]|uniref:RING-type domain-containing protein n=1 Tax=Cymbomonas tetramitiformis TaxID=36881 RepID=A0AAE0EYN6_9CHLO|nr:hypothetical protein CYMTET_45394 [Cymbomonas tetramitiformis]